jgi:uncharacterized membrane protein YdbT with pleckstrin-like domain
MKMPFKLQEGEKIIEDIKPLPVLKWYFFLPGVIFIFFFLFILGFPILLFGFLGVPFFIFFLFLIIILYLVANNQYNYQHYWITDKRILYRRGILGYKISSIPFERVSDVIVSRTFLERIFGFGSVHVQSLAGQITYGSRMGAEGSLLAVPDPEELQKLIFELIKKKRKSEKLTM